MNPASTPPVPTGPVPAGPGPAGPASAGPVPLSRVPIVGVLRAELRKAFSTRVWWALGIPVVVLSVLCNLFGALLAGVEGPPDGRLRTLVPLLSLSYTLVLTSVFGTVVGIIGAAGEFRHHTASTTYLITPARGRVLLAKLAVSGLLGALYALVATVVGVPAGLLGAGRVDDPLLVLGLAVVGMLVGALCAAAGSALGTAVGNQVGALVGALVYLLLLDRVFALLLAGADSNAVARLAGYLPGKAADIAVYGFLADGVPGSGLAARLLADITAVPDPPRWWVALLVLAGWTAAAVVLGWALGDRRDVT